MRNQTTAELGTMGLSLENVDEWPEWNAMAELNQDHLVRVCA